MKEKDDQIKAIDRTTLLTEQQSRLLGELYSLLKQSDSSEISTTTDGADASGAEVTAGEQEEEADGDQLEYEAFYYHWRRVEEDSLRKAEWEQQKKSWGWIEQLHQLCGDSCEELENELREIANLDAQQQEVARTTSALHESCEGAGIEHQRLKGTADQIMRRLDAFESVAEVSGILERAHAADAASLPDFSAALDRLEASAGFLESHRDFKQAQECLNQLEHLRSRACVSLRSGVTRSLDACASEVDWQLNDQEVEGSESYSVDTQVFYGCFRAAAPNSRPLTALLRWRSETHEAYASTLGELEGYYARLRIKLVAGPVKDHLGGLLQARASSTRRGASGAQEACAYVLQVARLERQCFEAYFEAPRQGCQQEALRSILDAVSLLFFQALQSVLQGCGTELDALQELAECLKAEVPEPSSEARRGVGAQAIDPVAVRIRQLHEQVVAKIVIVAQTHIIEDVQEYRILEWDLNYPSSLFPASAEQAAANLQDYRRGWFPTLDRVLGVLAKTFHVLEASEFQDLSHRAVVACVLSLKRASKLLADRPLPDQEHLLGLMLRSLDSQLFLIKHLLILWEQMASFDRGLGSVGATNRQCNMSLAESVHPAFPAELLRLLAPWELKHASQSDCESIIKGELLRCCGEFVVALSGELLRPLSVLSAQVAQISDTAAAGDVGASMRAPARIKDLPFMAEGNLRGTIDTFLKNVREQVPIMAAHLRLYLTSPGEGNRATEQNAAVILFDPLRSRVLERWAWLKGLLHEQGLPSELVGVHGALPELLSSLFAHSAGSTAAQLADVVNQVPRAHCPPPLQKQVSQSSLSNDVLHAVLEPVLPTVPQAVAQLTLEVGKQSGPLNSPQATPQAAFQEAPQSEPLEALQPAQQESPQATIDRQQIAAVIARGQQGLGVSHSFAPPARFEVPPAASAPSPA